MRGRAKTTSKEEAKRVADKYVMDGDKPPKKKYKPRTPPKDSSAVDDPYADEPTEPQSVKELLEHRAKQSKKKELEEFLERERQEAMPLNAKQRAFVHEYSIDLNGLQAAIRAGYAKKAAGVQASDLLKKPNVKKAVQAELVAKAKRCGMDADRLLNLLADQVTADVADLFDGHGNIKDIHDWPMAFRQGLVKKITIKTEYDDNGEKKGRADITTVEVHDRKTQIALVGKHIGVQAFSDIRRLDDAFPMDDKMKAMRDALGSSGKRIASQEPTGTQREPKTIEGEVTARTKPKGKQIEG